MYYMPEERLNIGRRVFTQEISKEKASSEYNISITTVVNYVKEYMKANKKVKGFVERKIKTRKENSLQNNPIIKLKNTINKAFISS